MKKPQYVLVDAQILPEVYTKVLYAKQLLATGKAKNSTDTCRMAGISRSAYYKYKDSIFLYEENNRPVATIFLKLFDQPGVLSSVLTALSQRSANILTVNQNIPAQKVASVTISVRMEREGDLDGLIDSLTVLNGVLDAKLV
ncbi:MAG TPA: ACT domain-containing protein [Firmicutes bacterium]|nr:ACT domain-containing protein [Bacillota bacterium]